MANSDRLSPIIQQSLVQQIATRVPRTMLFEAPGAAGLALGESFRIRVLPLNLIEHGTGTLADRLQSRGQWHHQVYQASQPVSFARSVESGAGPDAQHQVVEVARSTLPQDLEDAIKWVDDHVASDAVASIVMAPSYFLTAIWLIGPTIDAVVIASMPDSLSGLAKHTLIPSAEFLRELAQNEPIQGAGSIGG